MTTLCTLQNLTLTYPHKTIFQDVSFTLNEGEKIGVLGLNGHGKSSLFKILAGLIPADTSIPAFLFDKNKQFSIFLVPQELPIIKGVNLNDYFFEFYPEFKKRKIRLDSIEQRLTDQDSNFDALIHEQTQIYDELAEMGEDKIYNQYLSYLKYFGLSNFDRNIFELSGGEQRKVALSLGLSAPHQIVLWDEPTNHLDLETIQIFEEELQNSNKTYMIISHDRSLLNNVVDRIVHIQHGKIKSFKGTYAEYLLFLQEEQKNRVKELDKLSNFQRRETAWIRRGVSARRTKSKKRIADYQTLNNTIQDLKARAHKQVSLSLKASGRKTKILIEGQDLELTFGKNTLFKHMDIKICKGDKISLIGRNGVGKSSLLKLLTGEMQVTSGLVKRAENLSVGFFSQKRESLDDNISPWQLIGEGIDFVISNTGEKRHVASYLENFLFSSDEIKRPIHTFSGGEKNRLQLAKFMRHAQDIWIFDEPTNDLDLETIGILEEELKNYQGALIIVGHDRTFIENVTDKCFLIDKGKLEIFEAGFVQAEMYMDALALEEKLKEMSPVTNSNSNNSAKPKMSNKERQRYQVVPSEIEQQEQEIEQIKDQLSKVDYTQSDANNFAQLEKLQAQLKLAESKLEVLFNEWCVLEEKAKYN